MDLLSGLKLKPSGTLRVISSENVPARIWTRPSASVSARGARSNTFSRVAFCLLKAA
jgi:hypothetical protein